jgi:hypothetical protein
MNVRYSLFALLLLAHSSTHPVSAQDSRTADNVAAQLAWETVPTRKLKPRDPPKGWIRQSDADHSVIWYSPAESDKLVRSAARPATPGYLRRA